jgi:chitin synthase
MLAAFLEWFLWLAAFLYCLVKVYQKAENISVKVLAIIMMVLFTLLRSAKAVTFISLLSQLT